MLFSDQYQKSKIHLNIKKITIITGLFLIAATAKAQWDDNGNNLTTSDNVGIGLSAPQEALHVEKSDAGILLQSNNDAWTELTLQNAGAPSLIRTTIGAASSGYNYGYIGTNTDHDFVIRTNNSIRAKFDTNGRLGIGTNNPHFNLDVAGNLGTSGNRFTVAQGVINQTSTIENWGSASDGGGLAFNYDGRSAPNGTSQALFRDFSIYNGKGEIIGFFDGSNKSLGINTTSTGSHKLAVEGSIGAREIKVQATGWSDFVFENDYDLRTLEEVEEHITENGHLPEIPSETEVTENGINLGEMNAKLLQKIEELTLYLIEQNKELKELKEKVENLENK
ncbi:MAG: hypothetical protein AAGA66_06835 [Bacteroidota bacterium]